jgi:hypothetical protein
MIFLVIKFIYFYFLYFCFIMMKTPVSVFYKPHTAESRLVTNDKVVTYIFVHLIYINTMV